MRQAMTDGERRVYKLFVVAWFASNMLFWIWWPQFQHWGFAPLFIVMSLAFFYDATVLPSLYLFYLGRMRLPIDKVPQQANDKIKKVAVITLTVPGSESLEIVERQLGSISRIKFPHDSWILVDKHHSEEIKQLASKYGVKYFSRHDIKKWGKKNVSLWNQPIPPFQEKTKAGNVNAWLNAHGYKYSHFTQFDIDHQPNDNYLDEVLGYFSEPTVAWVQAPSVYGNFSSWTARGSAEQEMVLQGPLQMGFYGFCETPFIIGSHCTYDTKAILEINGFQPTRAEDHLDTVMLASRGKKGVFLPKVIAVGDGPENFEMYLKQQFAWAYSMIQVLFNHTPKLMKNYTPKQAVQFLFVQTWYPLWSISVVTLFCLPILSLILNKPISSAGLIEFMIISAPMYLIAFAVWLWSRKWQYPKNLNLSWRGIVLHAARWVVVLQALIQVVFKVKKPYMITIKGIHKGNNRPFSMSPLIPYLLLISMSLLSCWFYIYYYISGEVQGYLLFALQGAALLLVICLVALVVDFQSLRKEGVGVTKAIAIRKTPIGVLVAVFLWWSSTLGASAGRITQAVVPLEQVNVPTPTLMKISLEPTKTPEVVEPEPKPTTYIYQITPGMGQWHYSFLAVNDYIVDHQLETSSIQQKEWSINLYRNHRPGILQVGEMYSITAVDILNAMPALLN